MMSMRYDDIWRYEKVQIRASTTVVMNLERLIDKISSYLNGNSLSA
jgi:hypothetical protein